MPADSRFESLWATPLGLHHYAAAAEVNPLLTRVFGALRATQPGGAGGAFFASSDDLLTRVRLPEWDAFVSFVIGGLRDTVAAANAAHWPRPAPGLRIAIEGMWFQCANHGAFHEVHTHGNCSWSGIYMVQIDDEARRVAHPVHGQANGVTRFYGPYFTALAGAHADLGNAYLQPPHIEIKPVLGQLIVFPSWLPHQAMPYEGEKERVIVSFNASVHAAGASDALHGYADR